MRLRSVLLALTGALLLSGCGWAPHPTLDARPGADPVTWRAIATDPDRERLRAWRDSWVTALNKARAADPAAPLDAPLFQPDLGLESAMPPAGDYRCRTFRLGATAPGTPDFQETAPAACRIEQDGTQLRFTKTQGRHRPDGVIFPDTSARGVFLGTLILSDETTAIDYGRDDRRDLIGIVTRIGDQRWRLAIPGQALGPMLELIEITPAG